MPFPDNGSSQKESTQNRKPKLEKAVIDSLHPVLLVVNAEELEEQIIRLEDAGAIIHRQPGSTIPAGLLADLDPDCLIVYSGSGPEECSDLIAAIRNQCSCRASLPILIITDEASDVQRVQALENGADALLAKSLDPALLTAMVRHRCERFRHLHAVQQKLENALQEQQRSLEALDAHAIVSIADRSGKITYANDRFCKVSGYSRAELIGQNHRIVRSGHHPPEFYRTLWKTIAGGRIWRGEICNRKKNGTEYWVATTITPFLDDAGVPYQYISIRTDITLVKEKELQVRRLSQLRSVAKRIAGRLLSANTETPDHTIQDCLEPVGEALQAKRIQVYLSGVAGQTLEPGPVWQAPGTRSRESKPDTTAIDHVQWLASQVNVDQPILVSRTADLPPEANAARASLEQAGIDLLCAFCCRDEEDAFGLIGLQLSEAQPPLNHEEQELLSFFANALRSALRLAAKQRQIHLQRTFLQSVLDSIPANIAVVDRTGTIQLVNERWRSFGNQNDYIGTNYLALCRQVEDDQHLDLSRLADNIEVVLEGGAREFTMEYPCESPAASLWFELRVTPLQGPGSGAVIAHFEITNRKQLEEEKLLASERLERGQRYANLGTWEWEIESGALFWTETVWPLFGLDPSCSPRFELFLDVVHPEDRNRVTEAIQRSLEHGQPYEVEHRVIHPDGTVRWVQERGAVERNEENQPVRMTGVVLDIQDRKLVEMALANRERQLLEAQFLAQLGDWSADLETGHMHWSEEAFRIFGMDSASSTASEDTLRALIHPEDLPAFDEALQSVRDGGKLDLTHRIVRPDGRVRHVHALAVLHQHSDTASLTIEGTFQDVTDQVQLEQSLRKAVETADRANAAKSEFLSRMSHDLRTPLNAIIGFGQLMDFDPELPADHRESVSEIMGAGQHLLELVNDVLDLAKIESGRVHLDCRAIAVEGIIAESCSMVSAMASNRDIRINQAGALQQNVLCDPKRLKQALVNLLSNAVKYNREGGAVDVRVESAGNQRIRIHVSDTGYGIPEEKIATLFEPFNRLDAEFSEVEGTGIGLTITRKLLELMDGELLVESEVNVGTTFSMDLPAADGDDASSEEPDRSGTRTLPGKTDDVPPCCRILYVEDNLSNIKLVSQVIQSHLSVDLMVAQTPAEAIKVAEKTAPSLVLLDINLPEMDGYQVVDKLRSLPSFQSTPVIALTANAMPQDIERGRQAGFAAYLTKPIDIEQLLESVRAHLPECDH